MGFNSGFKGLTEDSRHLRLSENRVLRGIFKSRKSVVAEGFRRVRIMGLHKRIACLIIFRLEWKWTRWARHVTCMRKSEMLKIITGNTKERRPVVRPMHEWELGPWKKVQQLWSSLNVRKSINILSVQYLWSSLNMRKSRKKPSHVYICWLCVSRHKAHTIAGYESLCGRVHVTSVMFRSEIVGTVVVWSPIEGVLPLALTLRNLHIV